MPADSVAAVVKFTISIPRASCTNAKAKYSSSVVILRSTFTTECSYIFKVRWFVNNQIKKGSLLSLSVKKV